MRIIEPKKAAEDPSFLTEFIKFTAYATVFVGIYILLAAAF